jgi:hypothetical protein
MGYQFMPSRPVSVVELTGYRRRAGELLSLEEQDAVIDLLAYEPACGDVIPGTGGLAQGPHRRRGSGKRGGARVVYYFHDPDMPIYLLALYAKNEKDDLNEREKKEFAALVREIVGQWRKS